MPHIASAEAVIFGICVTHCYWRRSGELPFRVTVAQNFHFTLAPNITITVDVIIGIGGKRSNWRCHGELPFYDISDGYPNYTLLV